MTGYSLIAASGGRGANTDRHSCDRVNGGKLVKEACRLYDRLNDRIMEEGNKLYICMSLNKRLRRLAVLAHQRYMRRQSRFHMDE